jgi:tetratricopeptide (TPR) repeat protein
MIQTFLRQGVFVVATALLMSACTGAESRKASFVAQSQRHMTAHDWQKARLDLRNALQIDPKDQKLQFLAAQIAEKVGEYDEAAGRYRALLEQDKGNVAARAALARLYAGGGLPAEAIKLAEEGLASHPEDPALLTARGVARGMSGDNSGALKDAESAAVHAPTNPDTVVLLASMYQRQGRNAEALQILRRASAANPDEVALRVILAQALGGAGRAGEAEQQLLAVVKFEPRELRHRYRLAQFYVLQKNVDAAERTLRDAVVVAPDNVEPKLALANLIAAQRSFETGEKSLKELIASDSGNLELQLGLGRFYEVHQRPGPADAVYRKVATAAGDKAQGLVARNRLAALALAANRNAEAGTLIDEILKANPRDNDALTMRADIALARGDTTSAIADLRAVLRDQPNAPALMRALAAAYATNRDVGLAEETLRTAMRANPSDVQTRLALADLLMKNGRGDEAQPMANQLVTEQPGDPQALEAAFRIQVQRRDFAAARQSAETIHSLRPDLPAGDFLTGLVDEAEGKLDAARGSFERAVRLAPGFVEPLAAAVRIDLAQHQGQRALARVEEALAASPKSSGMLDLKAEVLAQLKRFDESAEAAGQAIARSPSWWVAYDDLARAETGRGRPEAAVAAYERGIQATQSAPPLLLHLAALLDQLGRLDRAMGLYEDWLRREPGSEIASNNLAMLLLTHKSAEPASLDRALELARRLEKSTQPEFIDTLGWVHYLRGEYAPAIEALQRAVAVAPEAAVFRAHLGLAQLHAGQRDAARDNLQRALSASAGFPEAAEARAALAQIKNSR